MRLRKFWWLASLACTATISALPVAAQEREGEPRGPGAERGGMMMRMNPVLAALDANQDGEISAEEIEQATAALKKLDADGDGKLTIGELGPARGRGGEGAPAGGGEGERGPQGRGPGGFGPGGGGPGGGGPDMVARMMERDANGDGKLTAEEAGERLATLIQRADADGDGAVTKQELLAAMPAGGGRPMGSAPGFGPGRPGPGGPGGPGAGGPGAGGPGGPGGPGVPRGGMFGNPEQFVERLFQLDANDDGNLTRDELMRIGEVMGAGRPPGEGPGRGPGEGRPEREGGREGGGREEGGREEGGREEGGREEGRRARGPGGR